MPEALLFRLIRKGTPDLHLRTPAGFAELFQDEYNDGMFPAESKDPSDTLPKPRTLSDAITTDRIGTLVGMYEQIQKDHDQMRFGMVQGKLSFIDDNADGGVAMPAVPQRNVGSGFLNLHDQIIIEASRAGLRWGGVNFGSPGVYGNGDMQHFDLNMDWVEP